MENLLANRIVIHSLTLLNIVDALEVLFQKLCDHFVSDEREE